MKKKEYTFSFEEIELTLSEVLQYMGYNPNASCDPVSEITAETFHEASLYSEIHGGYIAYETVLINPSEKTFLVDGIRFSPGRIVFSTIASVSGMVFFVCTAGQKISAWSQRLMKDGDLLKGYIADVLGSLIVEKAMNKIQDHLRKEAEREEINITNRYSPGYCQWDVAEQHKLFSLFPPGFCHVSLTDSALMTPIKSVSGVIGTGKQAKWRAYQCNTCKVNDCLYRKIIRK